MRIEHKSSIFKMQQFSVVYEGKKKLFKLASSNTIQQVAVQVAADFGIDGINSITLRHKKTILDPSLPLRFANGKIRL